MIQSDSTHTHTSTIPYPNTTCSPRRFDSISISVFSVNWFHVFLWSLVLFKTRSVEKHNFNWSNLSALPARSSQQPILNSLSSGFYCLLITAVYPSQISLNIALLCNYSQRSSRSCTSPTARLSQQFILKSPFCLPLLAHHSSSSLTSFLPYSWPLVFAADRVAYTRSSFTPVKKLKLSLY